jgi:hypothetical protein
LAPTTFFLANVGPCGEAVSANGSAPASSEVFSRQSLTRKLSGIPAGYIPVESGKISCRSNVKMSGQQQRENVRVRVAGSRQTERFFGVRYKPNACVFLSQRRRFFSFVEKLHRTIQKHTHIDSLMGIAAMGVDDLGI